MKKTLLLTTFVATVLAAGCASTGMEHRAGSGPGMGMGMSDEATPGWSMMSESERDEHRSRMRSGMSADDCQRYMQEHHRKMTERAKERGTTPPGAMRHGMCAGPQR